MTEEKEEREALPHEAHAGEKGYEKRDGDRMRAKILQEAHTEFIAHGFRDASLRQIATRTGIAVSNIYNYYKSKDVLFRAVLQPLLEAFDEMLREHSSEENMEMYVEQPEEFRRATIKDFLKMMLLFRAELKLLFLGSGGSSLEGFKDEIIQQQFEVGVEYVHNFRKKYPEANGSISPLFIRISSHWWLIFVMELVANEHLTEEDIEQALSEYVRFDTAGWKELMSL